MQGAKAAQKRERNAKNQASTGKSSLKSNEAGMDRLDPPLDVAIDVGFADAAKNIICTVCKQSFVSNWS
jgi:hypothetical protein